MTESKDKLPAGEVEKVQAALESAKKVAQGDDVAAIQSATSDLQKASHAMAEVLYKNTQAPGGDGGEGASSGDAKPAEGDVVDAEFSESK